LRRMRGGAQAHLLEAEDGVCYVVKFLNNPQHRRVLVNELIAASFLRYLKLATPEAAIISVSPEFLQENPHLSLDMGARRIPVESGWHFGSRFPGDPARTAVYDFLPDVLVKQVANLTHFYGVLVLDKWMSNADGRQAIYFRARSGEWSASGRAQQGKPGFIAQMIDQGFVFNGPDWEFADAPLQGLALRPAVYERVSSWDDFQPWLDQVIHFPDEIIDQARRQVPPQWLQGDEAALDALLERLLLRRRKVADLISASRRARPGLFPNWR
jgi:HipA-like kinase